MWKGDNQFPFNSDALVAEEVRPPKPGLLDKAEQLARSRFKYMPVTVCVLDQAECAIVRGGFHKEIKEKFWDQLESIVTNTRHSTEKPVPFHDDLAASRSTIYGVMDLHHVIPISLCPVGLYPGEWQTAKWDDILEWWRIKSHTNLAAIPRNYHNDIHAVQDRMTMLELGPDCLNPDKASRQFIGDINIIMKSSAVWLPQQSSKLPRAASTRPSPSRVKELQRMYQEGLISPGQSTI